MNTNNRLVGADRLMQQISNKTGKKWPRPVVILGSGTNGVTFLTGETPRRVIKVAIGNASREVNALKRLAAAGANFVPRVNGNFVNIRKNVNKVTKKYLFPNSYGSFAEKFNTPETKKGRETITSYVMQKVGNTSLWRRVRGGSGVTNNNKMQIRSEIKRAIKFMHDHGISHGDLHAGNILVELDASGKIKKLWVIDFGRYVNIPVGQKEKNAYNTLRRNLTHNNYNLFNKNRKPVTQLYVGPTGLARRNQNLYREMYGGLNSNLA
jgi:serine/threonine protein kinase